MENAVKVNAIKLKLLEQGDYHGLNLGQYTTQGPSQDCGHRKRQQGSYEEGDTTRED